MVDKNHTARFSFEEERHAKTKQVMKEVVLALEEKGYVPENQLVGYFLSDDPSFITNYKNARNLVCRLGRYELLEEIVRSYLSHLED